MGHWVSNLGPSFWYSWMISTYSCALTLMLEQPRQTSQTHIYNRESAFGPPKVTQTWNDALPPAGTRPPFACNKRSQSTKRPGGPEAQRPVLLASERPLLGVLKIGFLALLGANWLRTSFGWQACSSLISGATFIHSPSAGAHLAVGWGGRSLAISCGRTTQEC